MRDLSARMFFSRALFGALLLSVAWTVSNVVAPYTIPPESFAYTVGSANAVDHWNLYSGPEFNWFARVVYVIGDAQCHQLWYRSIWLNGNQMPMDARMESIYLFASVGLITAMFARPSTSVAQGIVNALPRRLQAWGRKHLGPNLLAGLVIGLGILPVAVDGSAQLVTAYESTNVTRLLTGIPCGWAAGLLVGTLLTSIRQIDLETKELRARARLA